MKKYFIWFLILLLFLSACASAVSADPVLPVATDNTAVAQASPTLPVIPTEVEAVPAGRQGSLPTQTLAPTPVPEAQQKIRAIMEAYGHVDEKYLTETYWTKMEADLAFQGPANRILALEFHGDNYNFYGGAYSMTPESFMEQMTYLMANNYHFVTGPELVGFLEGWLNLPVRSIILTTDSGYGSLHSMPRIIADFQVLEAQYGYPPHMQSFIWTYGMAADESIACKDDICWSEYRKYLDSGYFTFGSHSQRHADFSTFSREETIWDLSTNLEKIKANLGVQVYGITWPLEACSPFLDILTDLGFKYAYGGWTRGMAQNFTYQMDNLPLCLPRLFPPNPWGTSGRPDGKTLEEMLSSAELINPLK